MKNILIIRSVSFQQLDLNLPAIKEKYSPCNISLLTHEHGVKLAEKYSNIDNVYVYPYKEGFDKKNKVKELINTKFDAVVVPVTNISGSGFFNVLEFSNNINSRERALCNVVSDINNFTNFDIYWLEVKNILTNLVSILATIILSPLIFLLLVFRLKKIEKR